MFVIAMRGQFPLPGSAPDAGPLAVSELDLSVEVSGPTLDRLGMLYDFFNLKTVVNETIEQAGPEANKTHAQWLLVLRQGVHEKLPESLHVHRIGLRVDRDGDLWWEADAVSTDETT